MRIAMLGALLLFLSACGDAGNLRIVSRMVEPEIGRTADPAAVTMLPVNFRVVTRDTLESFMTDLAREQGSAPIFIAITTRDYENMALNLADLRRYIEQQQAVILYYRQMTNARSEPRS